jgi:hypothetical protein
VSLLGSWLYALSDQFVYCMELQVIFLANHPASLDVNLYSVELWVLFVGHKTIEEMLFPLIYTSVMQMWYGLVLAPFHP